jgi:DNA repair protein RadC
MAQSSSQVQLPQWCSIVRTDPAAYERDVFSMEPVRTPSGAVELVAPRLKRSEVELFMVISLDAQHRPLGLTVVTSGLVNASAVHPREVFRIAIVLGASAVIVAHNHPSGDPTPSLDDRAVTQQLVEAGALLNLPVHDHILIAGDRYTSFSEDGLL